MYLSMAEVVFSYLPVNHLSFRPSTLILKCKILFESCSFLSIHTHERTGQRIGNITLLHLEISFLCSRLYSIVFSVDEPITVAELDNILHNDPAHRACQLEYKQLKEEFENYKKETRQKTSKLEDSESVDLAELTLAKQKSEKLDKELNNLRQWFEEKERDYIETISNLQCDVTALEERHSSENEKLIEAHKGDVFLLESQLSKQRERTLQLIADKDTEISRLKGDSLSSPIRNRTFEFDDPLQRHLVASSDDNVTAKRSFETEAAVRQLLTRQNSVCVFLLFFFP